MELGTPWGDGVVVVRHPQKLFLDFLYKGVYNHTHVKPKRKGHEMKKRVNMMIEDYDNDYLDEMAEIYHMSKSEIVGIAISLIASKNANNEGIFEQLTKIYDDTHPGRENLPMSKKIASTSKFVKVEVTK